MDIFNDDAFSLMSMTAAINELDHVPGRVGELAFVGAGEGVANLSVTIEQKGEALSLIKTSERGAPAPKEVQDKRKLLNLLIPQIKLEDSIGAHQIQGVRQMGSTDLLLGAQSVVNQQMQKMTRRHDLTLEHHRMGAIRGEILDSDGSVLVNLYDAFGLSVEEKDALDIDWSLLEDATDTEAVRLKCHEVTRKMKRSLKMAMPSSARIHALCGDNFFDKLIEHPSVKGVYDGWAAAERRLGANYVHGIFEFGGIFFENYQGTDDNETVAIGLESARFMLVGVPGLYAEYYAPADFMDTVNTLGLPRYARVAPDTRFNQYVELHTQQNPLPLCLRPRTLLFGDTGVTV
jgi:hypothetical protein